MRTDAELKQIAMDFYEKKIFSDRHVENAHDLQMIFMPIILGAFKTKEEVNEIGMIYEYFDKAGPRSINGYPIFMSMCVLNKSEVEQMIIHFEAYKKLKEDFTKQ